MKRTRLLLLASAAVGLVSACAGIALQGAAAAGESLWSALRTDVVGDVLGTRFGLVWGLGACAWLVVLIAAAIPGRRLPALRPASVGATGTALPAAPFAALIGLALPLAALVTLPALGGHSSVQSPRWLLLPTNITHVAAISAWLGGIAVLVLALRAATAALDPPERTRLLAGSVARFSALAGVAVAAIAITGIAQSIVYLESFADLVDSAFGRAVLIKSVLFVAICRLGYANRNRLLPRLRTAAAASETAGRAGVLLRRTLRTELALGAAVIAVTGALASYAPPAAESSGPYSTDASLGPARLEVTVDPARVGANEMHLYLFSKRDGTQYDATKELAIKASLPEKGIEPIELSPVKAGPGHYTVTGATFGVAGDWTVALSARVSEFDAYEAKFEVPIE